MSWLEGLAEPEWRVFHGDSEVQNIAKSAIAILKEDCHNCKLECLLQKYDELKEKYDVLLKEQEAVSVHDPGAYCPKCGWMLYPEDHPHHCGNCGQAVKWNV